jgi:hypothetical protein
MVKSNNIYGTVFAGIDVDAASLKVSAVENNPIKTVTNPNLGGGTGIELNCNSISSNQVHSNMLMDANYGYGDAPAGFAGSNNYLGVLSKIDLTSCCEIERRGAPAAAAIARAMMAGGAVEPHRASSSSQVLMRYPEIFQAKQ